MHGCFHGIRSARTVPCPSTKVLTTWLEQMRFLRTSVLVFFRHTRVFLFGSCQEFHVVMGCQAYVCMRLEDRMSSESYCGCV